MASTRCIDEDQRHAFAWRSEECCNYKTTQKNPVYEGPTGLFINNNFVESVNKKMFATVCPRDETVLARVQEADAQDVDIAVKAAKAAFEPGSEYRNLDGSTRARLMNKLADLVEKHQDALALWESLDNGKPVKIAKAVDIGLTIKCLRYYAGFADKGMQGKTIPCEGDFFCYTRHEPVGVVGAIIPWNFPLLMIAWKFGPAIAAGCTMVMKSSEKTPLTALMFADLVKEAGFPAGVFNLLSGHGIPCGQAIVDHPDVDKVAFTGSSAVGGIVRERCAKSMKRVSCELGGKSPLIVFADADLDKAMDISMVGVYLNSGQCCCASSRIFVHEDVYDDFVQLAKAKCQALKFGDPLDDDNDFGPIVDKIQYEKVIGYIQKGLSEGARCVAGGECRKTKSGYYVKPTVFADCTDDMVIIKEEIFGPVMSILKFSTFDEAIKRANETMYGLGAGVCTKDMSLALKTANLIKAGTVWVNTYDNFDAAIPFGGYKMSGIGREKGEDALKGYTEVKCVCIAMEHGRGC